MKCIAILSNLLRSNMGKRTSSHGHALRSHVVTDAMNLAGYVCNSSRLTELLKRPEAVGDPLGAELGCAILNSPSDCVGVVNLRWTGSGGCKAVRSHAGFGSSGVVPPAPESMGEGGGVTQTHAPGETREPPDGVGNAPRMGAAGGFACIPCKGTKDLRARSEAMTPKSP